MIKEIFKINCETSGRLILNGEYVNIHSFSLEKVLHEINMKTDKLRITSMTENFKDEETDVHEEKIRYLAEASEVCGLSLKALNASKNVIKQAGRDYDSWIDIIALMREEVDELEEALTDDENRCFESLKRSKEELGDVGACGVLLLDWINSREEK